MAKGYSLDALVVEHYIKDVSGLGDSSINDKWGEDNVGTFFQNLAIYATVKNGYPAGASAGNLEVILTSGGNLGNCIQRYTNFNDLRMWIRSQKEGDGIRTWTPWKEFINADTIYKAIYPIGIVLQFDNATNPNNTFTGTVWEQITDGRTARAATGPEAGTADGQIGSTAGSDTAKIAVTNLPGHTHGMQNHTHWVNPHSHSMDHNHTIDHDHGGVATDYTGEHSHSLSGDTTANGDHSHSITVCENDGSGSAIADSNGGGIKRTTYTGGAGNHNHAIRGTANPTGKHNHWLDLPNFTGTSGWSSEGVTGGISLTTDVPSNNTTTSTGDGTAFGVRNASHYYAFWKRVA